jgi:hypothetical protein
MAELYPTYLRTKGAGREDKRNQIKPKQKPYNLMSEY